MPFDIKELEISHLRMPQVAVNGASSEAEAAKIARSVAGSSLVKARFSFLNHLSLVHLMQACFIIMLSCCSQLYMAEIQTGDA